MIQLLCATGNAEKFGIGHHTLAQYGITLEQISIDIDEIQHENPEIIVRDKAAKAFAATAKPVVITDDSWDIPGLHGFPGPYMKSMNHWLNADDFVRLTTHLEDRRIILHQYVAYHDGATVHVFTNDILGELRREPAGKFGPACMKVAMLSGDNGKTISETYDLGMQHDEARLRERGDVWGQLGTFLQEHAA
jgi:inosine/xanthosine triphosphate pyrophosphatase family protein